MSRSYNPKAPGYAGADAVKCSTVGCAAPAAPGYPCPYHWEHGPNAKLRYVTGGAKAARGLIVAAFMVPVVLAVVAIVALAVSL